MTTGRINQVAAFARGRQAAQRPRHTPTARMRIRHDRSHGRSAFTKGQHRKRNPCWNRMQDALEKKRQANGTTARSLDDTFHQHAPTSRRHAGQGSGERSHRPSTPPAGAAVTPASPDPPQATQRRRSEPRPDWLTALKKACTSCRSTSSPSPADPWRKAQGRRGVLGARTPKTRVERARGGPGPAATQAAGLSPPRHTVTHQLLGHGALGRANAPPPAGRPKATSRNTPNTRSLEKEDSASRGRQAGQAFAQPARPPLAG